MRAQGAEFRLVYVIAPEGEIRPRLEGRSGAGVDASEATYEHYLKQKERFEPPQGAWLVNNDQGPEELKERVLAIVKDWSAEQENRRRLAPHARR